MSEWGKKCDLSEFDCGMIVGSRQGDLSIPETTAVCESPRRSAVSEILKLPSLVPTKDI